MPMKYSCHTSKLILRLCPVSTLCGMYTIPTVWKLPRGKTEVKIKDGRSVLHLHYLKTGKNFSELIKTKTELFCFLAQNLQNLSLGESKQLYSTSLNTVLSSPQRPEDPFFSPCTHEEADTHIILHVAHYAKENHRAMTIRTVDTDVLVLAVSFFSKLGLDEIYVALGIGKSFKFISCHEIVPSLGYMNCQALPVFHSLTGSDTTSSFSGKGKKSAWEAWKACPAVRDIESTCTNATFGVKSTHGGDWTVCCCLVQ